MVEHQPSKLDTWVRFPSPAFFMQTGRKQKWSCFRPVFCIEIYNKGREDGSYFRFPEVFLHFSERSVSCHRMACYNSRKTIEKRAEK